MTPTERDIELVKLRNRGYRWISCAMAIDCSPHYCRERYQLIARDPKAYGIPDEECQRIEEIKRQICKTLSSPASVKGSQAFAQPGV